VNEAAQPTAAPKPVGRLTVKVEAYHQLLNGPNPWGPLPIRWQPPVYLAGPDGQPWTREMIVGPNPRQLDYGWVERASLLLIQNMEGSFTQTIPTSAEKAVAEAKVVEVLLGVSAPPLLIPPGGPFLAVPDDLSTIWLRSRSGQARCMVYVYPT